MKKLFLIVTFFCTVCACKKQIVEPVSISIPCDSVNRLPRMVVVSGGTEVYDTITFFYNQDNLLERASIKYPNNPYDRSFTYTYENKKVVKCRTVMWKNESNEEFTYTAAGMVSTRLLTDNYGGYRFNQYVYNAQNELSHILSNGYNENVKDSMNVEYAKLAVTVFPPTGEYTLVCNTRLYNDYKNTDQLVDESIDCYLDNERSSYYSSNVFSNSHKLINKGIDFQYEVGKLFLPIYSNTQVDGEANYSTEKAIYGKYIKNKYRIEATKVANNEVSTFVYKFDNLDRLVKVITETKDGNANPYVRTYQIIY